MASNEDNSEVSGVAAGVPRSGRLDQIVDLLTGPLVTYELKYIDDAVRDHVINTRSSSGTGEPATAADPLAMELALGEYFDWLNDAERFEDDEGNIQARDALARASSKLGCLLIKHGVYSSNNGGAA